MMQREEFVDFAKFVALVQYLRVPTKQAQECLQAVAENIKESKALTTVESMISELRGGRYAMARVIRHLPQRIKEQIESEEFLEMSQAQYTEADADESGALDAKELTPILAKICKSLTGHSVANQRQCELILD